MDEMDACNRKTESDSRNRVELIYITEECSRRRKQMYTMHGVINKCMVNRRMLKR